MENIVITTVQDIEKLIVTLRGKQVLLDRDLAYLYQVEVKQMNRQVKRNIERFPEDFLFQLTKEEYDSLKCQIGTSNERGGDRRALPYAFTQQGIGMLSGLLRSQVAINTNIKIMRAFVGMQSYITASMGILQRLDRMELQQFDNKRWMKATDNIIETILKKIDETSPQLLPEQVFQTGCVWMLGRMFLIWYVLQKAGLSLLTIMSMTEYYQCSQNVPMGFRPQSTPDIMSNF